MKHVMIDIETMGTGPMGALVAVGALMFSPIFGYNGAAFHRNVSLQSSLNAGMEVQAKTIEFWMEQPKETRDTLYTPRPEPIKDVISDLRKFLTDQKAEFVWANAPAFDLTILRNAYTLFGQNCPWHWRKERDMRTVMDLASRHPNNDRVSWVPPKGGVLHHPVDDCVRQVFVLHKGLVVLGIGRVQGPIAVPSNPVPMETSGYIHVEVDPGDFGDK